MRTLASLNEYFINRAHRSVIHNVPLTAKVSRTVPILPTDRWQAAKSQDNHGSLTKSFKFQNYEFRDRFVLGIIDYENHYEHRARVTFDDLDVTVTVVTRHVNIATELDTDYTKFCDTLYRDVVYNETHEYPNGHRPHFDEP